MMGKSVHLKCDYLMATDIDHYHIVSFFNIDRDMSSRFKEGDLIQHCHYEDRTGPYTLRGPLVVVQAQYSNYDGRNAVITFVKSGTLEKEVPNTWQNHPNKRHVDVQYLSAAQDILYAGARSGNRTTTPTTKLFGHMMQFDMRDGFPLVTTKFTAFKGIMKELGWLCRGETNIKTLGAKIWDGWADNNGNLGPVYGAQWRAWEDTRTVADTNTGMIDFLINQNYIAQGSFDQTSRMDEELRAKIKNGDFTLEDFQGYLEQNGMRSSIITTTEASGRDLSEGTIQMYFGDNVLELPEYNAFVETYYRVLNALGIEGKWDAEHTVYTKKFDQLDAVAESLKNNPNDRRMLVTALNPGLTPVTQVAFANQVDRKEHYLDGEIEKVMANVKWMDEAERRLDSGGEAPIMQARDYCESLLHNGGPSDLPEGLNEEELLEALLDYVDAPKVRYFEPHENATVGQQALPPCHMMFQLGTSPMSHSDRYEHWSNIRTAELMQDSYFMEREGLLDYNPENPMVVVTIKSKISQELFSMSCADKEEHLRVVGEFFDSKGVPKYFIDMTMYQRSADWFIGVPFNIGSYSALLMAFAQKSGMAARNFFHMFGDYHIYDFHRDLFEEQMKQEVKPMPSLEVKPFESFDELTGDHFVLHNYEHGPKLDGEVAI